MSAILEKLTAAERARESVAREAYCDLVQQIASDTALQPLCDVQEILSAAGKSTAELSADVSKATHRNELRAKVAEAEAAAVERQQLLEQIEATTATLEAAKRGYDATVRPLQLRLAEINQLAMEAAAAKRELVTQCADDDLLAREQSNRNSLQRLDAMIREQRGLVCRVKSNLDQLVRADADAAETAAKRERWEAETAKLDAMRAEQAALVAESNEIVEAKIDA